MECLVCGVDAFKVESDLDGKELRCPDCGHFGVSGSLLSVQYDRRFDVMQTRGWFERQRRAHPQRIPVITSAFVFWVV
jgi:hypothetical protein